MSIPGSVSPDVLSVRGVSKAFGAVQALRDVSLDVRAGEIHALVGENGSGKSTLLGICSGFLAPDEGGVEIGGRRLRRASPALARQLELPDTAFVRRYRARAYGHASQAKLDKLKDGVTVDGVSYGPVRAVMEKDAGGSNHWITVAISEGKNREVRKLLEHVGLKVNRLIRLSYGPFELGDLIPGEVQELSPKEVREHLKALIAPQNLPQGSGRGKRFRPTAPVRGSAKPKSERGSAAPGPAAPAAPEKKTYKAGWARPKAKAKPAASARPQRRSGARPKGRK